MPPPNRAKPARRRGTARRLDVAQAALEVRSRLHGRHQCDCGGLIRVTSPWRASTSRRLCLVLERTPQLPEVTARLEVLDRRDPCHELVEAQQLRALLALIQSKEQDQQ